MQPEPTITSKPPIKNKDTSKRKPPAGKQDEEYSVDAKGAESVRHSVEVSPRQSKNAIKVVSATPVDLKARASNDFSVNQKRSTIMKNRAESE